LFKRATTLHRPLISHKPKPIMPNLFGSGRRHRLDMLGILQLGLHFELVLLGSCVKGGSGVLSVGCVESSRNCRMADLLQNRKRIRSRDEGYMNRLLLTLPAATE